MAALNALEKGVLDQLNTQNLKRWLPNPTQHYVKHNWRVARDLPSGNRIRLIKINAQHKVLIRAIEIDQKIVKLNLL